MSLPLYDDGIASGLISGVLFGYVLESAGFASPRKLTAQFRFTDWSVFKVMFTAIIVAGIGLYGAIALGLMPANGVFIPTNYFWAMLAGGALVGAGMAVGGYCPGTSAVGLASGRLDGLFFMIGMVLGTGLFAGVFDWIKGFYFAAKGPDAQTLGQLFGVSNWVVLAVLVVVGDRRLCARHLVRAARRGGPLTRRRAEWRRRHRRRRTKSRSSAFARAERSNAMQTKRTEIRPSCRQPIDAGGGDRGDRAGADAGRRGGEPDATGAGGAQSVRPGQSVRAGAGAAQPAANPCGPSSAWAGRGESLRAGVEPGKPAASPCGPAGASPCAPASGRGRGAPNPCGPANPCGPSKS